MKKSLNAVALVLMLSLTLSIGFTGCGKSGESTSDSNGQSTAKTSESKKVTLKLATILSTDDPAVIQMKDFAKRVNESSKDEVEIQVYPNSELGGNKDVLEAIVRGANLVTFVDPAALSDYVPDYSVMNGPYLYDDYKGITKLAFSDWGKEMADAAAKKGIKVLDNMSTYFGTRQLITNKPVNTPDDMKGLKVRVPSTPLWLETVSAMGGSPTSIAWSEVYSALQQGVADAAENPLAPMYASKLHEVRKYISETCHFIAPGGLEMSSKYFDGLSPEHQKILVDEAVKFAQLTTEAIYKSEADYKKKMEEAGVKFNKVDAAAFKKATEVVYTKFPQWTPGVYERVKAILAK